MRQVTHALLTRPPLSHQIFHSEEIRIRCFVRLACVKHAASVHPEPGSNSRLKFLIHFRMTLAILPSITVVLEFIISDDVHWKSFIHFQGWLLFNYQCSCLLFFNSHIILTYLFMFVNNFFIFLKFFLSTNRFKLFGTHSLRVHEIYYHLWIHLSTTFFIFFHFF